MAKAVFFDRDGVLNVDTGLITNISQINLYNGIPDVIEKLRNSGFKIFVVTNQPIVARGLATEDELVKLNQDFQELLLSKNKNAIIDKIAYCPHHPEANLLQYRQNCECRKPKPGMIMALGQEYNIDLKKSYMVGDRISDIIAGYLAGCKTVHCLTGRHEEKPIVSELTKDPKMLDIKPDYIVKNITELERIIL